MELHPYLEKDTSPNDGLWYVLSAFGDCPSVRVGHTCTYIPGEDNTNGKVIVIGGANPSGPFAETFILDLDTFTWDTIDASGFRARYEHACFVPKSQPNKIYVYGGADQSGNHNDMQVYDVDSKKWNSVQMKGNAPSPRTYHNSVCVGDSLIVYSGGQCGSDPVGDRQVYSFDVTTSMWTTLKIRGDSPKPRHGHLVIAHENKVFIHGGMSGAHFYDDLHVLNLDKKCWNNIKCKKVSPCARAAHGGVVADGHLYVFGGMNRDGALDDMYRLSLETLKWSKVELEGPPPACRLDFGVCTVRMKVALRPPDDLEDIAASSLQAKEVIGSQLRMGSGHSRSSSCSSAGSQRSVISVGSAGQIVDATPADLPSSPAHNPRRYTPTHSPVGSAASTPPSVSPLPEMAAPEIQGPTKTVEMMLLVGGMDTEGEIFDDCLVFLLKDHGEDADDDVEEPVVNGAASA